MRVVVYPGGSCFADLLKSDESKNEFILDLARKDEIRDALLRVVAKLDAVQFKPVEIQRDQPRP